jgi:hypothetical protein
MSLQPLRQENDGWSELRRCPQWAIVDSTTGKWLHSKFAIDELNNNTCQKFIRERKANPNLKLSFELDNSGYVVVRLKSSFQFPDSALLAEYQERVWEKQQQLRAQFHSYSIVSPSGDLLIWLKGTAESCKLDFYNVQIHTSGLIDVAGSSVDNLPINDSCQYELDELMKLKAQWDANEEQEWESVEAELEAEEEAEQMACENLKKVIPISGPSTPPMKSLTLLKPNYVEQTPSVFSYSDADRDDPVDKVVTCNAHNMISGDSGSGKSTFVKALLRAVADGVPFLGIPTKQRKVLYLDYENTLPRIREHFQRAHATDGDNFWY